MLSSQLTQSSLWLRKVKPVGQVRPNRKLFLLLLPKTNTELHLAAKLCTQMFAVDAPQSLLERVMWSSCCGALRQLLNDVLVRPEWGRAWHNCSQMARIKRSTSSWSPFNEHVSKDMEIPSVTALSSTPSNKHGLVMAAGLTVSRYTPCSCRVTLQLQRVFQMWPRSVFSN